MFLQRNYLIVVFSVSIILVIICLSFFIETKEMLFQMYKYELFDGYVYKVEWKPDNGKCISYYSDHCYKYRTIYDYIIYANNTDNFCMANIQSETNITDTIMSDYYNGKNVIWSKLKNEENRECSINNSRHHYKIKADMYNNYAMIIMWILVSMILFPLMITVCYYKFCNSYNQVNNTYEVNSDEENIIINNTKDTERNNNFDIGITICEALSIILRCLEMCT